MRLAGPRLLRILLLLMCLQAAPALAQATRAYADPQKRFSLQYPQRDWRVLPGTGSTLATLAENRGRATVQIEYLRLNQPLQVEQNRDLILQIESDLIRERQPGADQIAPANAPDLPSAIVIEYNRRGADGSERVRQFSLVREQHLFRILCAAQIKEFARFQSVFAQIARSFEMTLEE